MSARDAMQDAPPAARWPIASAHLQRGVPGLRYPRTLGEAFKDTADYACAVEGPRPGPRGEWWLYAACAVLAIAVSAAVKFFGPGWTAWIALQFAVAGYAWRLARREG